MVSSSSIQRELSPRRHLCRSRLKGVLTGIAVSMCVLSGCSGSSKYFQDAVNQATQDMVGKRYGAPHKTQVTSEGGEIWTYFERGSGTAGFGGQVRGGSCRAYVLAFDKQKLLRHWDQQRCQD